MKNLLTIFLTCLLLLVGKAMAYAATPPTAPVWLATSPGPYHAFDSHDLGLFWNPSTSTVGLAGYNVYRCLGSPCTFPTTPTFTTTQPYYLDGTVSSAVTYSYAIAAYDTAGNISAQSTILTASTSSVGTVSAIEPVITLQQPTSPVVSVGQLVDFSMIQSQVSGVGSVIGNSGSYSWGWDFGDNTTLTMGSDVPHTYSKAGTYLVKLTVFNQSNPTDYTTAEQTVTVLPAAITNATMRLSFIGDINDYSGNQLLVQAGGSGVPAFVTGVTGTAASAIYLDGTSTGSYVTVTDNSTSGTLLDSTSSASLALFVKKNTSSASGTVYVKQGVYSLAIASQGVSATLTNASGTTVTLSSSTVSNNDTNWHHYALTYNGTIANGTIIANLYFDGALVASTTTLSGSLAHAPSENVLIGETIGGSTFNGVLDVARFYNTALTAAQVDFLYNGSESISVNGTEITLGDVNNTGGTNLLDASLVSQDAIGLVPASSFYPTVATVSGDANPSEYDASLIAQKSLGLILKYPEDIAIQ